MTRYLKILLLLMKNCLVKDMQFRANFAIRLVTEVLWLGFILLFVEVLYGFTDTIAGWNKWHMIILLGTNTVLTSFFEAFFFDGCMKLSDEIRKGDLDFILLKPINAQFLGTMRYTDYASVLNGMAGFLIVGYGLRQLGAFPSAMQGLLYFWLLVVGIAIYYGLMFTISTLTFWMGRSNNLFDLYWQLGQFGRYPGDIYRFGLRVFLMTLLPMVVVTNFPARVLFERLPVSWVLYATGLGVLFVWGPSMLWKRGLARYRSASS